jgi:hypothetical protein
MVFMKRRVEREASYREGRIRSSDGGFFTKARSAML